MKALWRQARRHLAGGVSSPVRAFRAVGGTPVFIRRAKGARVYDANGKAYIDYCLSWGAIILGHADRAVVRAIGAQAADGTSFGTPTEIEIKLARKIQMAFPAMERIRFTSSGTEAVMSAVRLARGITKRERIVKFEGCYHGHVDSLLVRSGSGLATFGTPNSAGIPPALARATAVLPYNDRDAVRRFFKSNRRVAAVIVEPVAGNMGVVPAQAAFLECLREITRKHGTVLIFDEVISGFRVAYGGAQQRYGIAPDLTILGKVIGGGLSVGAFGGRASIMRALSPTGPVYQAGTLSGNPLAMAAGLGVLEKLTPSFFRRLNHTADAFIRDLKRCLSRKKLPVAVGSYGSMFTPFFASQPPRNFKEALRLDTRAYARFFHALLRRGVYLPPSAYETAFLSASHGQKELDKTLRAVYDIDL